MMRWLITAILFCVLASPANAADEKPAKPASELKKIESDIKQHQAHDKELAQKSAALARDIGNIRGRLITVSARMQKHEAELDDLEAHLAKIGRDENALSAKLQNDHIRIGHLVEVLLRMARTPPDMLIFAPQDPRSTINTTLVLQSALSYISDQVKQTKTNLDQLADMRAEMDKRRAAVTAARAQLAGDKDELAGLLKARENTQKSTESERAAAQAEAKALAEKAADLRDLIAKLKAQKPRKFGKVSTVAFSAGAVTGAPVMGAVKRGYGAKDAAGTASKGITIASRNGAVVTAPLGGDVAFAGAFRSYGQVVIIEIGAHQHLLLTGLGDASVATGDHVNAGEPVGKMPESGAADLYLETRRDGEPVNPREFGLSL